jgi:polyadenylate-binding protein
VLNNKKQTEFDSNANILVRNLSEEMTQGDLNNLFKEFGEIISCKLELGPDNKSRMYGYVQFSKSENAQAAIAKLHGKPLNGKELSLTVLTKRAERDDVVDNFTNLYVSNIPQSYTENDLRALFEPFGEIQSIRVLSEKQCGFVKFAQH